MNPLGNVLLLHNSDFQKPGRVLGGTLWGPAASRQKFKKPLLTFGETGQETNIYILGAFGWVVFFVEGEFFLEAEGCKKNTNCYWNRAELWETGFVYGPTV